MRALKIEWLVANVTPVGFLHRAERDILGMILGSFLPIQAIFVVGEPLCDVEIPAWAPIPTFTKGH